MTCSSRAGVWLSVWDSLHRAGFSNLDHATSTCRLTSNSQFGTAPGGQFMEFCMVVWATAVPAARPDPGRAVAWLYVLLRSSTVEVAASPPAVRLRPELALQLHQAQILVPSARR
jgi:hypothetical protein